MRAAQSKWGNQNRRSAFGLIAVALLAACGEASTAGGGTTGPQVVVPTAPAQAPDRWRVLVKRLAATDAGMSTRAIADNAVAVDGRTIRADGFAVRAAFLPPGDGPLYLHAIGLAGEVPVVIADGYLGTGTGDDVEISGWVYDAACDVDQDTYRDCGNVAAACCTSIPATHRDEVGDCRDDQSEIEQPETPDRKRRDAAAITPFAPAESADDYALCDNRLDDDCAGGDLACAEVDGDGDGTNLADDCDDSNADIHPGAYDAPGDGVDQDCNNEDGGGTDQDGDGFLGDDPDPTRVDCDDANVGIHPGAGEASCDGVDQDCDGEDACIADGTDIDGDGVAGAEDCDDHDAGRRPGAREACGDGIDQDCNGSDLACDAADTDKDGSIPPADCNEGDPEIHPGAAEICGNDVDEDCDGRAPSCRDVVDGDGDTYPLPGDCNDLDATVSPGAEERCNNVDDDCDGVVDEGNPRLFGDSPIPHEATCGRDEGACRMGPLVCAHREDGSVFDLCLGDMGSTEICDGFDNDCDGLTDVLNGGQALPDEGQMTCGPEIERGACHRGTLFCRNGSLSDCRGAVLPSDEVCNGTDDDCDGQTDNGPGGEPVFESCYGGPENTMGVGECRQGIRRCVDGQLAACDGEVQPGEEVCDGLDNDCNAAVDDEISVPCWDFEVEKRGIGACHDGQRLCEAGVLGECVGQVPPSVEVCDGLDNDCDRLVDSFNESCYNGDPSTIGAGRPCHAGLRVCNNGVFTACMGEVVPQPELCDSQDNDCDGTPDEDFDFNSDPLHCGACNGVCAAGQACCSRACRDVNTVQNCGGCGTTCDRGADRCGDLGDGNGSQCLCGDGAACQGGLRCIGGACLCQTNDDCGANELCCGGRCEATDPGAGGQCGACDDGGCDPATAQTCTNRECRCGENAECQAGLTVCGQRNGQGDFLCLGCRTNTQCGANERCCQEVCVGTSPDTQCESCGTACDPERADTCRSSSAVNYTAHDFTCACGAADAACDANGPTPWCIGGVCEECRTDADCGQAGRGQCVDHICRACDPGDHAGCAANGLCCNFQCSPFGPNAGQVGPNANQQCQACGQACNTETTDTCANRVCKCGANAPCSGATPHCKDDSDTCVECLVDNDCANDPDGRQCVANVCRVCDPNGHDGCGADQVCCGAGQPGVYRCEATGPGGGDQCEACDAACDTRGTNRCSGRACGCGNNAPCNGATPVCDDARGQCFECVVDGDCAGPGHAGGQCVNNVCRPCDPGDQAGCAADQLCCNFQCTATGGAGNQQCESCGTACGATADTCLNRNCVCGAGANAVECGGNTGLCINGACRQCQNNNQCGPNELCCNNACQATGPAANQQCQACNQACTLTNSNLCEGRTCKCGNNPACGGGTPVCDDANGRCVQCTADGDCPNNGQCVANVCRACDPGDHAGCGANQLCCNFACQATGGGLAEQCGACGVACPQDTTNSCSNRACVCGGNAACSGATLFCNDGPGSCTGCRNDNDCPANAGQCVAGACRACDPADDAGCTANGNTPVCGANFVCRGCQADGDCADNATGTLCNAQVGRCRRCNAASDAPCDLITPICDEVDNRCEDCVNDQECTDRPGAEDQCVAGDCRACDPTAGQGNAGCDAASGSPICSAATLTCRACQADNECGAGRFCNAASGRCGACDPTRNSCAGATPVCDAMSFTCRACGGDPDCVGNAGGAQCVAGQCRACDPATADGCTENSATPICDGATFSCRACGGGGAGDTECTNRPGNRDQCVAGNCRACDPADDTGCNANGATPNCSAAFVCEACTAQAGDTGCPANTQCITGGAANGMCKACDPTQSDGCVEGSATPICDAATYTCRGCANMNGDAECNTRTGAANQCVANRCRGCDPGDDAGCTANSGFPNCSAASFSCVPCAVDADCGGNANGGQCIAGLGACKTCDPVNSDGCVENSASPICDQGTFACRGCANGAPGDTECTTRNGTLDECVANRCRACDPGTGAGCDLGGTSPVCDGGNFSCRACGDDGECSGGTPQCVASGACEACDTVGNTGCGAASNTPICAAATNTCAACTLDNQCTGNANGEHCIVAGGDSGECHACDQSNDEGCGVDYCSAAYVCTNCGVSADCANNGNGNVCVGGDCKECATAADCNMGLVCMANTCQRCLANAECAGHPDGNLCDLPAAGGSICRTCTTNQDCRDNGFPMNSTCDNVTHTCSN